MMTLAIIVNTIILSLDKYPADDDLNDKIDTLNIVFSIIFICEFLLKLIGFGIHGYFSDGYNIFDSIIALASIVDVMISSFLNLRSVAVIKTFRAFRIMRVFKLAKNWKKMDVVLKTIKRTLEDISVFSILLGLFMFTFALLGMELFAYRARFNEDDELDLENGRVPNNNFDNLLNSFTTVFVVITGDGWSQIYFNSYRALSNPATTIFFIVLVIIGQRVLLNLFLTILL